MLTYAQVEGVDKKKWREYVALLTSCYCDMLQRPPVQKKNEDEKKKMSVLLRHAAAAPDTKL